MKWTIENMKRTTSEGIVVEVLYRVVAKEGSLIAGHLGRVNLESNPESPDFVPFNQLTEEQVLSWVKSEVDVSAIETQVQEVLNGKLAAVAAKETVTGLPWKNRVHPLTA